MYLILKAGGKWSLNLCGIATFGSIFWYLLVFQPEIVLQLFCFSTTEASNSSSSMHMYIISFQWRSCQKLILHLNHVMSFTSITATNILILISFLCFSIWHTPELPQNILMKINFFTSSNAYTLFLKSMVFMNFFYK